MSLSETQFRCIMVCALALLGFLTYANTFSNEFVWDDASSVLLHRHVQDPTKVFELFREDQHAFGRGQGNFYRPLVSLSFMADFAVAYASVETAEKSLEWTIPSVSPFLFHLSNCTWHVLAAVLFFVLMTRMGAPRFVRAVAPIVFVVHPLHTEAVAYISGRADSMAAAFLFAGLVFALAKGSRLARLTGAAGAVACFIAGLLSKESALIFPLLLFLVFYVQARQQNSSPRRFLLDAAPTVLASVLVVACYGFLRSTVLNFAANSTAPGAGLGQRLIDLCQAFALYIALLFFPSGLHMERTLDGVSHAVTLAGLAALVGCTWACYAAYRRRRWGIVLGLAWFLGAWLPISGLFPLNAPMAEHWMYVPMAGFLWALADGCASYRDKPALARALTVALTVWTAFLLVVSMDRNRDWHDNETLYIATLKENPDSLRVRYLLAVTYDDIVHNPEGALREYEQLLRDNDRLQRSGSRSPGVPPTAIVEANEALGRLYFQKGEIDKATAQFRATLSKAAPQEALPYLARAAYGLGRCLLATGDRAGAERLFGQALRVLPQLRGDIEDALTEARKAEE